MNKRHDQIAKEAINCMTMEMPAMLLEFFGERYSEDDCDKAAAAIVAEGSVRVMNSECLAELANEGELVGHDGKPNAKGILTTIQLMADQAGQNGGVLRHLAQHVAHTFRSLRLVKDEALTQETET